MKEDEKIWTVVVWVNVGTWPSFVSTVSKYRFP